MIVLSYGYKKPEDGDRGSVWFPALSDNITRLNGHTHDGSNSAQLSASVIQKGTCTAASANWSLVSTAKYSQTVTTPAGFTMDEHIPSVRLANGDIIHPTIVKVSSTSFTIYTLDNTLTYTIIFR